MSRRVKVDFVIAAFVILVIVWAIFRLSPQVEAQLVPGSSVPGQIHTQPRRVAYVAQSAQPVEQPKPAFGSWRIDKGDGSDVFHTYAVKHHKTQACWLVTWSIHAGDVAMVEAPAEVCQ